ncbi:hypothetical protein [Kitasatospora sp. KL5]|uniref:hypothetical protein n=1 Tax=Kitasatospora sp. KL5 TaxID=3425125 RepID=UPI003D6E1A0F
MTDPARPIPRPTGIGAALLVTTVLSPLVSWLMALLLVRSWRDCLGFLDASAGVSLNATLLFGVVAQWIAGVVAGYGTAMVDLERRDMPRRPTVVGAAVAAVLLVAFLVLAGTFDPSDNGHCPGRADY